MKKGKNVCSIKGLRIQVCPSLSGRKSIFVDLFGNSCGLLAHSKKSAYQVAEDLRDMASWISKHAVHWEESK